MMAPGPRTVPTFAMSLFEPIFAALENGTVRYVVVGGMATVLHGYARLTADVDIIVDQEDGNLRVGLNGCRFVVHGAFVSS